VSSSSSAEPGTFFRLLQKVVVVRPEELRAVGWCWVYAFSLLAANYILTPIRDQMGVAGGVRNLPWLFVGTLAGTVLLNIPFAWLVKKLPRSRFIPLTYRFFAVMLLLFGVAMHFATKEQSVWVGRIFFIWVSVTNLFAISVFWQLNVDLFNPGQGKRLFGFIAAGATIGAIVGSAYISLLARMVSPTVLLISAAVLFEVASSVPVVLAVSRRLYIDCRRNKPPRPRNGRSAAACSRASCTPCVRPTCWASARSCCSIR
jgi:AAA family ATP:ADP antiporter